MPAKSSSPNILLVVIDCARSDKWLGQNRHSRTPVLDRLQKQAITFPNTITEKSCTTPSFCGLLTGAYSTRHGVSLVWGYRLPDHMFMLTQGLNDAGYHTYAEVTGPLLPEMGLARGFTSYTYRAPCDYLHTAWGDQLIDRLGNGTYRAPWLLMLHLWELHLPRQVTSEFDSPAFGRDPYERAVSSLDAQLERIFAAVGEDTVIIVTGDHGEKTGFESFMPATAVPYASGLLGVEESRGPAAETIAKWAGPSVLQQLYGQCQPHMQGVRLRDRAKRPPAGLQTRLRDWFRLLRLTPWLWLHDVFALWHPVRATRMLERRGFFDPQRRRARVERFMQSLGPDELLEMHIRMWTNTYRREAKEGHIVHVYDYLARVPLIIRWPGVTDGSRTGGHVDRMVRLIDLLPSVLDLLGLEEQGRTAPDGRSFAPLLRGRSWQPSPAFLSVSGLPHDLVLHGVRTETHKYTYGPHNNEFPEELYDLQSDPNERHNRADSDPDRCAELRALTESLIPESGAAEATPLNLDADQQQIIERRLQELGYIE